MDIQRIANHLLLSDMNYIGSETALHPDLAGKRIFDMPLFGYGDPNDPYFDSIHKDHPAMKGPKEWMPSSRTVISVFFPYSGELKRSNKIRKDRSSYEWFHIRIEGQRLIENFLREVKTELEKENFEAIIPVKDPRFKVSGFRNVPENMPEYSSNWSERHAAYACGLGTFSMTKALITEKGSAGRLGSILTSMETEFTEHSKGLYDNCTKCGACIAKCPVSAISADGKDNSRCAEYLGKVFKEHDPYYGCSECQVGIPCESRIPKKVR